jgi:hypothetical protein
MQLRYRAIAAVLLAASAATTQARPAVTQNPLVDCVDLGADHQAVRFGTQYVLIHDGDAYYRLHFNGSGCDALTVATTVEISTDGKVNRLCPEKSRLASRMKSCSVRSVDQINAETFEGYKRRR